MYAVIRSGKVDYNSRSLGGYLCRKISQGADEMILRE